MKLPFINEGIFESNKSLVASTHNYSFHYKKMVLFNGGPRPGPIAACKTRPKVSTLAAF